MTSINETQEILSLLKYEYRCKICGMLKSDDQEVLRLGLQLHELVMIQGISQQRAFSIINNTIHEKSINFKPLNSVNVSKHFGNHVPKDMMIKGLVKVGSESIAGPARPNLSEISPKSAMALSGMIEARIGTELQDFTAITNIYNILSEKLLEVDKYVSVKTDGEEDAIDVKALTAFTKIASDMRACINDINKIRKSGTVILHSSRTLAQKFCNSSMHSMMGEFSTLEEKLRKTGYPESLLIELMDNLKTNTINIFVTNTKAAVEDVMKEYKIKDEA